ncbi:beta-lactamase/transpeptidase-like protein [Xylariales sp. PMI_506]|nr:beta-lactamase/transpeptidase-like protein [Xylariales sp. PMI_506]
MTSEIDTLLREAASSDRFLGVSFVAVGKDDDTIYSGAYGRRAFNGDEPMTTSTGGWVASMSKLMTAVATLRAVELGLVGLDDDIAEILPEIREKELLVLYDQDTNATRFEPLAGKVTLRLLLSHSAGFAYASHHPILAPWAAANRETMGKFHGDFKKDWDLPMVFQPGTGWYYGQGLDWAGKVIEAVSRKSLEEFMQENIWSVLGMENTTFHPDRRPEFPMLDMGTREDGKGSKLVPRELVYPIPAHNESGGAGIFTTVEDYAKMLAALLRDDGKLLQKESIDELVKPQLGEASRVGLKALRDQDKVLREVPKEVEVDHALGGLYFVDNVPGGRPRTSIAWDGLSHPSWILDRTTGIAMVFFVQIMPFDQDAKDLWRKVEGEVYKIVSRSS